MYSKWSGVVVADNEIEATSMFLDSTVGEEFKRNLGNSTITVEKIDRLQKQVIELAYDEN